MRHVHCFFFAFLGSLVMVLPCSAQDDKPVVVALKHLGENKDGWRVVEMSHFRIFHKQEKESVETIAAVVEIARRKISRKWLGEDNGAWDPICELILHPDGESYQEMTGVPKSSPGHSRIESEPIGRIVSRSIHMRCDFAGFTETVLPHEITHVVLAGQCGGYLVPRWADEGMAILSESEKAIDMHRRNLAGFAKDGELFGLKEIMEMKDYPKPSRILCFYAQSMCLVDFLVREKDTDTFTAFIRNGLKDGYETSLKRHYNTDFVGLQKRWQKFLEKEKLVESVK